MNGERIRLTLAELEAFDPGSRRSGDERRFLCPLPPCRDKPRDDDHRSLSLNETTWLWRCYRCVAGGRLADAPKVGGPRAGRHLPGDASPARGARHPAPPSPATPAEAPGIWRAAWEAAVPLAGTPAEAYLHGRGVAAAGAAAGARYAADWFGRRAVLFPVRDRQGALVAVQGRYLSEGAPKVRSAGPAGLGVFAPPGAWEADPRILVEAPIDALSLAACGFPALATQGCRLPDFLPAACTCKAVLIATDGDAAGDEAARRWTAALRALNARVTRLRPPAAWGKDWNDALSRLGESTLRARLMQAIDPTVAPLVPWDENAAWEAVIAAWRQAGRRVPRGALTWVAACRDDLMARLDQVTEGEWVAAFAAEDLGALRDAVARFHERIAEIVAAFAAAPAQPALFAESRPVLREEKFP
jgi:hypothetical protein